MDRDAQSQDGVDEAASIDRPATAVAAAEFNSAIHFSVSPFASSTWMFNKTTKSLHSEAEFTSLVVVLVKVTSSTSILKATVVLSLIKVYRGHFFGVRAC